MSASHTYHRLTNYSPERPWHEPLDDPRLVTGFEICDKDRRPPEFKTYDEGLPVVDLPVDLPRHPLPATAVLGGATAAGRHDLTLAELARLLYYSGGIVRYRDTADGRVHYRAAGSAGNRHPLELYAVTSGLAGLPGGVWHHDPLGHRLRHIAPAPARDGATFLVVTGVPWRAAWKYAERAWRHLWWDCGTLLAQLLALADAAGLPARLQLAFPDQAVATLVGADDVDEFPLALVVLADGEPALTPTSQAQHGKLVNDPTRFPLITAIQQATESATCWPTTIPRARRAPAVPPLPSRLTLEDVVLRRGSARRFDTHATLPLSAVTWAMAVATRPVRWDAGPSLLHHHLILHSVDKTRPGIHRWRDGHLAPVSTGDQRQATHHYCLGTDLARDAAWLAIHGTDLSATLDRLGERGYRAAGLEAGLVTGRLHLAAHALGHAATGLVVNDELTPAFLRSDTTTLLSTALGLRVHQTTPGGTPRRPARLRPG
ncbi:nitroreductase family protein [Micromonospora sonneratiae]|uniref:Nitroreductase family protein n=1 Tax=Micromonospora sonneratiae TaxID=1184706 RepID=A0ABW3YA87_9ACTN